MEARLLRDEAFLAALRAALRALLLDERDLLCFLVAMVINYIFYKEKNYQNCL
jgi:hypothetical protein